MIRQWLARLPLNPEVARTNPIASRFLWHIDWSTFVLTGGQTLAQCPTAM